MSTHLTDLKHKIQECKLVRGEIGKTEKGAPHSFLHYKLKSTLFKSF